MTATGWRVTTPPSPARPLTTRKPPASLLRRHQSPPRRDQSLLRQHPSLLRQHPSLLARPRRRLPPL
jgi:hypothetical protein